MDTIETPTGDAETWWATIVGALEAKTSDVPVEDEEAVNTAVACLIGVALLENGIPLVDVQSYLSDYDYTITLTFDPEEVEIEARIDWVDAGFAPVSVVARFPDHPDLEGE